MSTVSTSPSWPRAAATLHGDGTGEVVVNGLTQVIRADDLDTGRACAQDHLVRNARKLGRPLPFTVTEPGGQTWNLLAHPDGRITSGDPEETEAAPPIRAPQAVTPVRPTPTASRPHRRSTVLLTTGIVALLAAGTLTAVSLSSARAAHESSSTSARAAAAASAQARQQVSAANDKVTAAQAAQKAAEDKVSADESALAKVKAAQKAAEDKVSDLQRRLTKAQAAAKKATKTHKKTDKK